MIANNKIPTDISPDEKVELVKILRDPDTEYMDHEEFHKPNPHFRLFKEEIDMEQAEIAWHNILVNYQFESKIDTKNNKAGEKYILTSEEERIVFLQMNYAKRVVHRLKQKYDSDYKLKLEEVRRMLLWYQIYKQRYNTILVSNLGLISAIGYRMRVFSKPNKDEITGAMEDGLLRAIHKFDLSKGFKFSTYAWRAIQQHGFRVIKKDSKYNSIFISSTFEEHHDPVDTDTTLSLEYKDNLQYLKKLLYHRYDEVGLTPIERSVIMKRFGFFKEDNTKMTLKAIGKEHGVTKERIRQLETRAIEKLQKFVIDD